jgi:hypothetical protein
MPTDPAGLVSQLEGARGTSWTQLSLSGFGAACTGATAKATKPMNVATITRISDFQRLEEGTVMSQSRRSRIGFRGGIADE